MKKILMALALMLSLSTLSATTTTEVFKAHKNKIFIETGSYRGDGIQNALNAGFKEIYSIELAPHLYKACCDRFKGNKKVHLYLGDSAVVLGQILKKINKPATFWLDGHYSAGDTAKGNSYSPILLELDQIAAHPIKTHTILIDDVRQFGTEEFDFVTRTMIIDKLLQINPQYDIFYEDGHVKNDVLVAEIK